MWSRRGRPVQRFPRRAAGVAPAGAAALPPAPLPPEVVGHGNAAAQLQGVLEYVAAPAPEPIVAVDGAVPAYLPHPLRGRLQHQPLRAGEQARKDALEAGRWALNNWASGKWSAAELCQLCRFVTQLVGVDVLPGVSGSRNPRRALRAALQLSTVEAQFYRAKSLFSTSNGRGGACENTLSTFRM